MVKVRKVLSFDVGIINLAYCLLEIDDENQTFKINKWGIIDLADNRAVCSFIKNTGEFCDKIANYAVKVDKHNVHHYCKAHVIKAELKIRPVRFKWWTVDPDDVDRCNMCTKSGEFCSNLIEGQYCKVHQKTIIASHKFACAKKKCGSPITQGLYLIKPILDENGNEVDQEPHYELECGWCNTHFDDEYRALLKKKTKKVSQNSNKISLLSLGSSMYQKLDQIPEFLMVDQVLVENQPTLINPTMKSVSAMLFSYFIMRGIHEKERTGSTIKSINFCSPASKITVGGDEAGEKLEEAADDKVYKLTKTLGVKFCKALIADNDEWMHMLESHKKQDDMADAFLQGIVRTFGSTLPEHYASKIKNVDISKEAKGTQEYEVNYEVQCKSTFDTGSNPEPEDITIRIGKKKSSNSNDVKDTDTKPVKTVKRGNFNRFAKKKKPTADEPPVPVKPKPTKVSKTIADKKGPDDIKHVVKKVTTVSKPSTAKKPKVEK